MLIAIILDETKNSNIISYINSFKKNSNIIDYNSIIIDLINKGLQNNITQDSNQKNILKDNILKNDVLSQIKQIIQDNIILKISEQIKEIIKKELQSITSTNNPEIQNALSNTTDTLNLILNKLNETQIVANVTNIEPVMQKSDYDNYIEENKKEINIDIDVNPLLMNILNNVNK